MVPVLHENSGRKSLAFCVFCIGIPCLFSMTMLSHMVPVLHETQVAISCDLCFCIRIPCLFPIRMLSHIFRETEMVPVLHENSGRIQLRSVFLHRWRAGVVQYVQKMQYVCICLMCAGSSSATSTLEKKEGARYVGETTTGFSIGFSWGLPGLYFKLNPSSKGQGNILFYYIPLDRFMYTYIDTHKEPDSAFVLQFCRAALISRVCFL